MAKDALGHGSDARGGSGSGPYPSPEERAQPAAFNTKLNAAAKAGEKDAINREAAHQAGVNQVGQDSQILPPESPESRELRLFADNDADLHRQSMQPIRDNLGKKMDKGVYDPQKAQTLFKYHADRAAQSYGKQFGGDGKKMFSPDVRREAAAHWEADERDDIKSGSSRTYKG